MGGGDLATWNHTPGWTYYLREVVRRHQHESAYVYVSDGGHWENLGIDVTLAAMVALVLGGTARAWGAVIGGFLIIGFFDIIVQSYLPLPKEWYGQAIPNIKERASTRGRWPT